ncbi:putative ABC transporter, ATP-binding protein [Desulfonema magnum]|uniref:ABC transporter, ATP-binding protein n=1 Tax=Desulfonema magnum TaxID=45655 RepID=A0A975GNJ5_9BACT|nr:putative ABC transporter, ATP-binding protein [Desulfonema magnum]
MISDTIILVILTSVLGKVLSHFRYLMLFIIMLLLTAIFYVRYQKNAVQLIEAVVGSTRERIIEKVRKADLESYERLGKSEIYNVITRDTQIVSEAINMFMNATESAFLSVTVLIYLSLVYLPGSLFIVAILGSGILIYAHQMARIKKWISQARDTEKGLFDSISDVIYGFKELKVNDRKNDEFFHHNFRKKTSENRQYRTKAENAFAQSNVLSAFIQFIVFIPMVFILPTVIHVSTHEVVVSVTMILFIPFFALKDTVPYLVWAGVSIERILKLEQELETIKTEVSYPVSEEKIHRFKEIRYDNICFTYRDRQGKPLFSIEDISFSLCPNEILFIIGGNGSGKSTLLKIITGLYFPLSGAIEIDGSQVEMAKHRYLFSTIFSDFHLFDRLYGLSHIDKGRVDELLRLMDLDHKLEFVEENRFSTLDLSTGQRKRLAMIASIMEDKPVYVFDEWAADQSPHFREYFYHELVPSFKAQGKSVIAVTHDDRYFHVADRVLKLDYGRLSDL